MINAVDSVECTPNGWLACLTHPNFNENKDYYRKDKSQIFNTEQLCRLYSDHVHKSPVDLWIMQNSINHQEKELFCSRNLAILSKGNLISNSIQTSYSSESNIKHVVWCKFSTEKDQILDKDCDKSLKVEIDCISIVDSYFLKIFTECGESFTTSLQFKVAAIWPTKYGILLEKIVPLTSSQRTVISDGSKNNSILEELYSPNIYSLTHPLNEIWPVIIKHGISTYVWESDLSILFTSSEPSFAFTFNSKTRLHSIYKIRKLAKDEFKFLHSNSNIQENTSVYNNSVFTGSSQCMINNNAGIRYTNTKAHSNNVGLSNSPFKSRGTSYSTAWSANISMSSQYLSKSHSPMATISRCQSPTNPTLLSISNSVASHFTSQIRPIHTQLPQSTIQTDYHNYTQYKPYYHQQECLFIGALKTELCLDHVWSESSAREKIVDTERASQVFLTKDFIGQTYLCYLLKNQHRLFLIRFEKSRNPEQIILGMVTVLVAKNAASLPNLNMMAVTDIGGNIIIYSGPSVVEKLHIPNIVSNIMGNNYLVTSSCGKDLPSPYPRRSSLISPNKLSTPDIKFDEGVHLLSPVNSADIYTSNCSSFDNNSILIKNGISNKIIAEYQKFKYFKIFLPSAKASSIVHMCLRTLQNILPRELTMQLLVKWYIARNAPGPQDLTVNQEWTLFLVIFFTLFGYEVNKLHIAMLNDFDHMSESFSPVIVPKKQRTINNGSVDDWSYLLSSEITNQVQSFLYDSIYLSQFKLNQEQNEVLDYVENEEEVHNKICVRSSFITHLPYVLYSLHLLYEEMKLKSNMSNDLYLLAKLLHQLSMDLNLTEYQHYYCVDFPTLKRRKTEFQIYDSDIKKIFIPDFISSKVPNIFETLYQLLLLSSKLSYPYLSDVNVISKNLVQLFPLFNNNKYSYILELDQFFKSITQSDDQSHNVLKQDNTKILEDVVIQSYKTGLKKPEINNFPAGIKFIFYSVINKCREIPPTDWSPFIYDLIERQDLAALHKNIQHKYDCNQSYLNYSNTSYLDEVEYSDGMNFDYTVFQLRFNKDHRVREIRKLLDSSKPIKISIPQRPDVSDHEFIEEQEKFLLSLCTRTMALPVGRGMFTLRTSKPINTEQLPIPQLCLTGKATPRGTTIELTHVDIPINMNLWSLFHNGVATGLCIHPSALNVDSTWIVYNKQQQGELGIEHSGFLMALGLNGHLKNLAPFSMYEYLVECHEATSVGLLLGLSATHRSSMNVSMTKLLSLHVETLLPPTSIELNVQQNVQVAALMGVGLVYQETKHRHIACALLSEIGRPPGPEMKNCVDRESYSLTAGLALGLVMLNSGGNSDIGNIPDTLHYYMIGGHSRPFGGSQKDKYKSPSYQIREGDSINIDVTSPGATIALGLMYLKSGNRAIAEWMTPPNTQYLLDFVRPDFLLLRTLAKSLILWDEIEPSKTWVSSHVPDIVAKHKLQKPSANISEPIDLETVNQAYCNVIAGACMALGLKFAGTENIIAFKTLFHFLKLFMTLGHKSIAELAGKATIETCLNVILLSASIVMSGTGNLEILRVCRHLRSRVGPTNSVVTYGSHVAIHMAIGFLFLGGGSYTLSNNPQSIAALVIALFPKFPTHSNDNRYHLQALRHFYVLAAEPRLLLPKDIDDRKLCYATIRLTFLSMSEKEGQQIIMKAPCLLPQLDRLYKIELDDERYWKITLTRDRNFDQLKKILVDNGVLHVKQRAGCLSYLEDPQGFRTLLARTLTTEDIIVWTACLKQITSFTTNKKIWNFVNRFLKRGDLINPIKCDNFCINLTHNLSSLCLGQLKNLNFEKFDVYNQIIEIPQKLIDQENNYLQILVTMTYECVIRDKMNFLPLWMGITKILSTLENQQNIIIENQKNSTLLWQVKFLHVFGLIKDNFREIDKVLSTENILASKQRINYIMDSWENDLFTTTESSTYVQHKSIQILSVPKFILYMLYHNVCHQTNFVNLNLTDNSIFEENTDCLKAYGISRLLNLAKIDQH